MGFPISFIMHSFLPLLAGNHETLFRTFRTIRRMAVSNGAGIASLVMGIACLIIVVKLIKMTYDLESDEQQAGFGGVSLWQIVRPVVILFALNIYPIVLGAVDGIADTISTSIVSAADRQDTRVLLGQRIAALDAVTNEKLTQEEAQEILNRNAGRITGKNNPTIGINPGEYLSNKMLSRRETIEQTADELLDRVAENSEQELDAKDRRARKKELRRWLSAYYKVDKTQNADGFEFKNPGTWIPALCNLIYDFAFIIIECGAEIILCILCFAGPVVLTVSLIDQYRHSFMEFIMRYFQFSFWKVVAAVINWAVKSAQAGACSAGKSIAAEAVTAIANGDSVSQTAGAASGTLWIAALIALAGIFCFSKIGELAAYFIPVNGGGMASGAGAALAAGAGAASAASKGASTIAQTVSGVRMPGGGPGGAGGAGGAGGVGAAAGAAGGVSKEGTSVSKG